LQRLKLVTIVTLQERETERGGTGMADFFRHVTDGMVLHASEAKNMSGGDFDGDEVWVSTNEDLLACMPEAIDTNSSSNLPMEMLSEPEAKVWTESTVHQQIDYALNFRFHKEELGKLSNLLEQYADLYGFDHPDTQRIGKAAFLQVRACKLHARLMSQTGLIVHSANHTDFTYCVRLIIHSRHKGNAYVEMLDHKYVPLY
jgi:RNA dependent RNA polymerase